MIDVKVGEKSLGRMVSREKYLPTLNYGRIGGNIKNDERYKPAGLWLCGPLHLDFEL